VSAAARLQQVSAAHIGVRAFLTNCPEAAQRCEWLAVKPEFRVPTAVFFTPVTAEVPAVAAASTEKPAETLTAAISPTEPAASVPATAVPAEAASPETAAAPAAVSTAAAPDEKPTTEQTIATASEAVKSC